MGLSIRRGTTKRLVLKIEPRFCCVDEEVYSAQYLPVDLTDADRGKRYKVLQADSEHPENSYYEWDGIEFVYIGSDKKWKDLGRVLVRLIQGNYILDKSFEGTDSSFLIVDYTQEDTIKLVEGKPGTIQVFCIDGSPSEESAIKSQTYNFTVLKSLWNEVVHNEEGL